MAGIFAVDGNNDVPLTVAVSYKLDAGRVLPAAEVFQGMGADRGAEMIRVGLEAAEIRARDGNGDLGMSDEYGLVYDVHSLRRTFARLLNQARVPLATAQRLMRHSDPKLSANIGTHVMVEIKAEAPAKVPEIAVAGRERAGVVYNRH